MLTGRWRRGSQVWVGEVVPGLRKCQERCRQDYVNRCIEASADPVITYAPVPVCCPACSRAACPRALRAGPVGLLNPPAKPAAVSRRLIGLCLRRQSAAGLLSSLAKALDALRCCRAALQSAPCMNRLTCTALPCTATCQTQVRAPGAAVRAAGPSGPAGAR